MQTSLRSQTDLNTLFCNNVRSMLDNLHSIMDNRLINRYKKFLLERTQILQASHIDNDWLNQIEKEICVLGLEIYQLRISQLVSTNTNINILKKEHKFKFNVELRLKDNFYNNETTFDKYLSYLQDSRAYDRKYGGTN